MNGLEQLAKLIAWLEASGDFRQEVIRLKRWELFLVSREKDEREYILRKIIKLAKWFEKSSMQRLGQYTDHVENYIKQSYAKHKWREDIIFCSQPRLEYHLNMVGAQIMNDALRESFLKQSEKVVFLPRCMCKSDERKCKAVYSSEGYVCSHCNKACHVNALTKLGDKNDFRVYIIPHESDFYRTKTKDTTKTGIVGIACVLNLLEGGFGAIEMGFVPQCVILDCCGCQKHWHKTGIVTELNESELKQVLGLGECHQNPIITSVIEKNL